MATAKKGRGGRGKPASGGATGMADLLSAVDVLVLIRKFRWLKVLDRKLKLPPGTATPHLLRVPVRDANQVLKQSVRLVADLPVGASGDVVWTQPEGELLVRTGEVVLTCAPGLVILAIPVACDQVARGATVNVPLAVGGPDRNAGLVMSSFSRLTAPDLISELWSEALTAFAWETLVHLGGQLAAAVGKDRSGKALVPASIGAERNLLLVQPMARNDLKWRTA